jgi:hypothetical protein
LTTANSEQDFNKASASSAKLPSAYNPRTEALFPAELSDNWSADIETHCKYLKNSYKQI